MMKQIALFDLDNTLISGDSDYQWTRFLIKQLSYQADELHEKNQAFFSAYEAGSLNMQEWLDFSLGLMRSKPMSELLALRERFADQVLIPMLAEAAPSLVDTHRERGDELVMITATNEFIAEPIVRHLNIEHVLATLLEEKDGAFTGNTEGIWCFREGKIERLRAWLSSRQMDAQEALEHSWAYSDSHNDIPLLEAVANPVAVNPDAKLLAHARKQDWQVLDLRSGPHPKRL